MKTIFLILLLFLGNLKAQNLKVDYDRVNKNTNNTLSTINGDDSFKAKVGDELKKAQKFTLYFLNGNTFFKNFPNPDINYVGETEKVDENTVKRKENTFTQAPVKIYHKKGDNGLYQYHNYNDNEFYHYATFKYDKIEYKDETELIENYKCKLVEITLNGSLFKVWYTEDVPVSAGPYMFNNLPGLVLKVDSPAYVIYATKITNDGTSSEFENLNPKLKVLNDEEFSKARNSFLEEIKKVKETHTDIRL
ncbi:GLPGLI family protein [Chryseobacterium sp. PET-29]|uniref:GLPGLI family protein n=1 Tax=Chryseobacterium sp. PET-29 TaxID=2983267 RepID=UPI0021E610BF|nr:GLPGLI family protein [Chryseobacterium sp. PET-29]